MSKPYPKYKDSGIEYFGKIPDYWEKAKVKFFCKGIYTGGTPHDKSYFQNGKINWYTPADFNNGLLGDSQRKLNEKAIEDRVAFLYDERSTYLTGIGNVGKAAISYQKATCNQQLNVITFDDDIINEEYGFYLLKIIGNEIINWASFTTLPIFNQSQTKNLNFLKPPFSEQNDIAKFLNRKTQEIDDTIAKKQRLIELLEEERKATINEAVTKGLNPNVKMKDSGIEWIGEIPEHWEMIKLKYLLNNQKKPLKTGPFGSQIKSADYIDKSNNKVINQRNVLDNDFSEGDNFISDKKFDELKDFVIHNNDILFTTRGTIGKCEIFNASDYNAILHPCLIRVTINEDMVLNNWIKSFVNNSSFFLYNVSYVSNATTIEVIYGYTLKEILFPIPPINEQRNILDNINRIIEKVDSSIKQTQTQIKLLKEYRQSLIFEAVTGKIDVREEIKTG